MSAFNQLRSHPADSADFSLTQHVLVSQLDSIAEVSQPDISFTVKQNIITLDVPMDNMPIV
jgi:hypothetical protein